jgi:hypothetical protein
MTIQEKRPKIVKALIEQSKQTEAVDLGALVVGTEVSIRFMSTDSGNFPSLADRKYRHGPYLHEAGHIELRSLGGNHFVTGKNVAFYDPQGQGHSYERNSALSLVSDTAYDESPDHARYGHPLYIMPDAEPDAIQLVYNQHLPRDEHKLRLNRTNVTHVFLDGQGAFY